MAARRIILSAKRLVMNRIFLLLALCLALSGICNARSAHRLSFFDRAMAAISTPELHTPGSTPEAAAQPLMASAAFNSLSGLRGQPWFHQSGGANPSRVSTGLIIAGAICTALGAAVMIAGTSQHAYDDARGHHYGHSTEYYIVGGIISTGGLAMLIPGIAMKVRNRN